MDWKDVFVFRAFNEVDFLLSRALTHILTEAACLCLSDLTEIACAQYRR